MTCLWGGALPEVTLGSRAWSHLPAFPSFPSSSFLGLHDDHHLPTIHRKYLQFPPRGQPALPWARGLETPDASSETLRPAGWSRAQAQSYIHGCFEGGAYLGFPGWLKEGKASPKRACNGRDTSLASYGPNEGHPVHAHQHSRLLPGPHPTAAVPGSSPAMPSCLPHSQFGQNCALGGQGCVSQNSS